MCNTFVFNFLLKITNVKTLKDRLIFARELRKLTQAELAKKSKCAQSAIGNVESGTRETLRNIVLVARALRVSVDWLYDGKGPKPENQDTQQIAWNNRANQPALVLTANASDNQTIDATTYDPYTLEVIHIMNRLRPDQRQAAAARLKEFIGYLTPPDNGQALPMAG